MNLKTLLRFAMSMAVLVLFAPAQPASAGTDADGVPDIVDNCLLTPNGAGDLSNQVDTDGDGYGNVCDADYSNDGLVTTGDYTPLLTLLIGGEGPLVGADLAFDHDGDGVLSLGDFSYFEQAFLGFRNLGE